jgi:hypothetical protein
VTDNGNNEITGTEGGIPQALSDIPLPVELSSFSAKINGEKIELLWQTKTEVDNYGFDIERRGEKETGANNKWEKIGFVQGYGSTNSPKNYKFTDHNPAGGNTFIYRLKQIDMDGKFNYSEEVRIELIPAAYQLYQNYPNPFNPSTIIKFSLPEAVRVKIDIFNIIGEYIVTVLDKDMEAGFHEIEFNAGDLTSGTYIYKFQAEDNSQMKKMIVIK